MTSARWPAPRGWTTRNTSTPLLLRALFRFTDVQTRDGLHCHHTRLLGVGRLFSIKQQTTYGARHIPTDSTTRSSIRRRRLRYVRGAHGARLRARCSSGRRVPVSLVRPPPAARDGPARAHDTQLFPPPPPPPPRPIRGERVRAATSSRYSWRPTPTPPGGRGRCNTPSFHREAAPHRLVWITGASSSSRTEPEIAGWDSSRATCLGRGQLDLRLFGVCTQQACCWRWRWRSRREGEDPAAAGGLARRPSESQTVRSVDEAGATTSRRSDNRVRAADSSCWPRWAASSVRPGRDQYDNRPTETR